MSGLPLLPESAPFPAEHIAALNGIMAKTNAEQRSWLAGFLAGYHAAGAAQPAPSAAPVRAAPLTILFGSESGNAEALAATARKAAAKLGFNARLLDMADATPEQVAKLRNLLVIVSTWGEGDPPQRAADFFGALMSEEAPRLAGLRFAVLALGDRAYAKFCETGRCIDERLAALGATRVADRIECDVDYEEAAGEWLHGALDALDDGTREPAASVIHVDFARAPAAEPGWSRTHPFEAEITELINLNGSRSSAQTFHVELSLAGSGIAYEPGDALGFLPRNDPELVEAVLRAAGLAGDDALRTALTERLDITTPTTAQIATMAALTGHAELQRLAKDPDAAAGFLRGRQVIDLLELAGTRLDAEQLTRLLRRLPPRFYSIASSRKAVPEEAHLLIAAVRWESYSRRRKGVASGDVAGRRAGEAMKVYLKPNPHFRLPADPDRPVIMIGPGTGVAPFRAFLQEREATGARGRNWLFFGHRNFTHDFLYQLEWQELLRSRTLTRMDVAFSRDQRDKLYVQHRMWEARRELHAWLQEDAALYVCGDAQAMAKDVHAMLARIVSDQSGRDSEQAEAWLRELQRSGRYLRDVY